MFHNFVINFVVLKSFNSRKLGLSKPIWHGHFASSIMLTFVLMRQLHLHQKKTHYTQPSPLCMVTKIDSTTTRLMTKIFYHNRMNDQKFSIANLVVTKLFRSPFMWWPRTFNCQSYGNEKFFVFNPKFFISNPMVTKAFFRQSCGN